MGLAQLLNRASSPNVSPISATPPPSGPTQFMPGPEQQWPPAQVMQAPTEAQSLSVPAFWRGHAYVTGTVGMLPSIAYRGTDALDPQPNVVLQPDPNQTPMGFWAGVASSLCLYGNSINVITDTDRNGWPNTLKPVHPTLCAVRFTGNPMAPTISSWYIAGQVYDPSEVWHIKSHLGRAGWPLGRGLIDTDGDSIAIALALQGFSGRFFNSGGMPTGVLKIHRPEITQDQADKAKQQWINKYAGVPSVAVLNELTDFTPVAYNPVDSQMIESRQFSLIEIALMWGLPPSKLGANVGGGTYKNAEMEEVQARNDAVAPWTRLLEEAGSLELLPRGQHLEWDLSAALRTDTLSQYQAYQAALGGPGAQSAWQLVNEIRARENMDPIEIVEDQFNKQVEAAGVEVEPPDTGIQPAPPVLPGGPQESATQTGRLNPPAQRPPAMPVQPVSNGKG